MTREEFINEINNNKYYSLHDVQIFIELTCSCPLTEIKNW